MAMRPEDLQRLQMLMDDWRQPPGAAPGGSGSTGLKSNDRKGWEIMLENQRWALNELREQGGQEPMQVRAFQTQAEGPGFAELYQRNPDMFHAKDRGGNYTYQPKTLYEHNALNQLRGWRG